jgi:hypothetical protein
LDSADDEEIQLGVSMPPYVSPTPAMRAGSGQPRCYKFHVSCFAKQRFWKYECFDSRDGNPRRIREVDGSSASIAVDLR